MLESILGSLSCERALIFLAARDEGYAREIASFYATSLAPVQKQLDKLEAGGVLVSKTIGRTRLYQFNPRYPLLAELRAFLDKSLTFYDQELQDRLLLDRRRPRRRAKPL
ncbi:MAG TPA: winged helix-turn-helix transcriptional regulator [Desulfuromonadales bacterium]|nr:winged helix-turn-helix transcriptional regulator [Desulfuromonadales bacterium]